MVPNVGEFSHTSRVRSVATGDATPLPVRTVTVANLDESSPSHAKNTKVSVPGLSGSCVYEYSPVLTSVMVTLPLPGRHVILNQMVGESKSYAII